MRKFNESWPFLPARSKVEMNSGFKENNHKSSVNASQKRRKFEDKTMSDSLAIKIEDDDSNANEVTACEDTNELAYFSKSSRKRLLSHNKRSPLASINKTFSKTQHHAAAGSSNTQASSSSVKTPSKPNESFYRRLQFKPLLVDPFASLSDEIILHIFQFLPKKALQRVACVNSRFSRISEDETLWIRMDLGNKALRRGSIGKVFSRGLIILRLAQARIQSPLFESHFVVEGFQTKLQYLDLSMASIDETSLTQLLSTCRLLKKLSLEQLKIDENVCKEIAENKDLEVLNLAMCEGLDINGLKIIMKRLQSLTASNISWTSLSNESMNVLVTTISPMIMRLNIAGSRRALTDSHVESLIRQCPNLVELDVSDCTLLTSAAINSIATLTKLEYLSVSRCYNIPMASYLALHDVKTLMYLDVFGLLSDSGLRMFEKTFKNIGINKFIHSSVARPTVLPRRTSIWGLRTRD